MMPLRFCLDFRDFAGASGAVRLRAVKSLVNSDVNANVNTHINLNRNDFIYSIFSAPIQRRIHRARATA